MTRTLSLRATCAVLATLVMMSFPAILSAENSARACEYRTVQVPAPSLSGNKTGEAAEQPVYIYLPPSYGNDDSVRYPVLYFFAGYYESSDISYIADGVEAVMKKGEFIIVSINDENSLHGTFGANSVVTGHWRDFFLKDAIPYIDSHFRTIATREGRMAGGFSMGGHVALRLAFEHPEVFSGLYAVSPGVFDEHGLENAMSTWDETFLIAYGAAYSPNLDKPYPHADWPSMDGSRRDLEIRAKWNSGFGNLPELLDAYLAQPLRLDSIAIEVGSNDEYPWIPQGCFYLNNLLNGKGLAHTFVLTSRHHEFDASVFAAGMGPYAAAFFSGTKGR